MQKKQPHDKKIAVLQLLSQEAAPISLPNLLNKLGPIFKERTIRRWLNEMVHEGLVEKTGKKRGMKYCAVQKNLKNFASKSINAIDYVKKPLYERNPTSYNNEWFNSYQPNSSFYLSEDLREKLRKAGSRANNHQPAGTYAHQIFNRLLIDLSYNSSRLEGNTYSLLDTEKLIFSGAGAEGKLDEEGIMILNHKEAIRYLVENAFRLKINEQTICTLHYLLSDGLVEAKDAGKVRDHGVRITGSTYMPYEDPKMLQFQLKQITDKANRIKDSFEQSFFLLVHISYLQAFSDVNKRTARLSANIPFIVSNLVPLSFNDVEKNDYTSAMIAIYELQDIHPLADLFVFSYMRTCAAYDSTVKALNFDAIRVHYRQQRKELIRQIISRKLIGPSMLSYIKSEAQKEIAKSDQNAFIEDILEDLEQIDASRIAGLGLTLKQFNSWQTAYLKQKM